VVNAMTGPSPLVRLQVHLLSLAAGVGFGLGLCAGGWCGTAGAGAVTVATTFFVDYLLLSRLYAAHLPAGHGA